MDTQEIISRTIGFLQKNTPQLQGIYLFGSRAAGEYQDDSDIDIAMLLHPVAAKQMSGLQIFTLQCDMSFELNIQVDLINLSRSILSCRWRSSTIGTSFTKGFPALELLPDLV
jgi:predicted nucleotidyltransferase